MVPTVFFFKTKNSVLEKHKKLKVIVIATHLEHSRQAGGHWLLGDLNIKPSVIISSV